MDSFTNSLGMGASSKKQQFMDQVRQQQALEQARTLIDKLSDNCFEKCIPKPGSSMTKAESTCITSCMEKYMAAWNTVSKQYIERIQKGDIS